MNPRSRIAQIRALSGFERRILVTAALLMPPTRVSLRLFGFKRTAAFASRLRGNHGLDITPAEVESIGNMCRAAAGRKRLSNATCLPRSVVLWLLLSRHGAGPTLQIGAPSTLSHSETFEAHAWVEVDGLVVGDDQVVATTFSPIESLGTQVGLESADRKVCK